ncbi:MAG TPA: 2-dehydropantoate 2-reductase [Methanotrichaceae archaeon]|nr:2-dehydropantoate 2-reductase [Methanotrichaceae archaeon]
MVNVLIYGAGAIGSFVGYLLSELEEDEGGAVENVALLGRKGHIQKILEDGLKVKLPEGSRTIRFRHCLSRLSEIEELDFTPDIVVVCVKTHSIPVVLDELTQFGLLDRKLKEAVILLLMNGMGNREMFDLPSHEIFEGITSMGVVFSENGSIELKGKGKTILESKLRKNVRDFLQDRFEEKGFEIEFSENFKVHQWNKLFANAVINPITALTRKQNGIVLSSHLKGVVEKIVEECVSVAKREGLNFDESEVRDFVYSVSSKTSLNTSSMLQDVLKGKRTEIDSINGHIVRLARKHSLSVPINETLYALIKALENGRLVEDRREK